MGNADYDVYTSARVQSGAYHRAAVPPPQPFFKSLKYSLKETFFPDDQLRQFKNHTLRQGSRPHRRNHHGKFRYPSGHQLRQACQFATYSWPMYKC
ncbi:hypothetical protein SLEP1_g1038 [Rubroshorea leprosula]|uniref:Uncharacterized protein n=1 Tax=Rubroshorea leprosula TaxID=152421 RepID=A0AAV5HLZ8_9ROSI|nr:hypothetical protein SLEP1_g1038 [Rubroshorea leprosula]